MSLQVSWFCHAIVLTNVLIFELVSNFAAIHAKRATIQKKDMEFICQIRKMMTGYEYPGEH